MFRFSLALIPLVSLLISPLGAGLALTRPLIGVVSEESHDLMTVDLDGDGREDILTINDEKGTIDILYGLSEEEVEDSEDPNGLPFTEEEVITGRNADGLAIGDLDGDGLADIVVGSERGGAAVFFQTEPRTFETARRLRAPGRFVATADWLGEGRPQLLAIATRERPPTLSCLVADEDRELRLQWTAPVTAAPGEPPRTLDWNGDGHDDLVWATVETNEVHVLLNDGRGGVGGEILVDIGQALDWAPLPLEEGVALLTLESASGITRLLVPSQPRASDSTGAFGGALHLALPESDSADRLTPAVIRAESGADVLLLPSHEGSEALLVSVDEQRGVQRGEVPSFHEVEMSQSLDGGRVLLLSRSEGMVGFAQPLTEGSHPPQPLPLNMEPLVAAAGQFNDQDTPDLIVIGRSDESELIAEVSPLPVAEAEWNSVPVDLPGLPDDDPTALRAADIDGNGLDDLVVFFSYRAPVILLATEDGFVPLSEHFQASSTFFEGVGANQFHVGDLDVDGQPEVLIARGGLIRVLSFAEPPEIRVLAQITAPLPGAELVAVSAAPVEGDRPAMICAVDRSDATVLICTENEEGAWEITSEVDLQIPSSQRLMIGDWDGDGVLDLAVKASQAVTVLFGGVTSSPLAQLATSASPLDDGRYGLLETLAWDGGEAWAHLIDHRHHALLIQRWDTETDEWAEVLRFPVFETPGERRRDWDRDLEAVNVQPREMAVADLDGDGLDDLVLLAHDHLLIYVRRESPAP